MKIKMPPWPPPFEVLHQHDNDWGPRLKDFWAFDLQPFIYNLLIAVFIASVTLLLMMLVKWYSDRYWKNTVKGIERIDKRLERIGEQLERMDRSILDYGERLDGVAMLVERFEEREQDDRPQDPLEAIMKEQRQIGR